MLNDAHCIRPNETVWYWREWSVLNMRCADGSHMMLYPGDLIVGPLIDGVMHVRAVIKGTMH